jgi:hypothetical protein
MSASVSGQRQSHRAQLGTWDKRLTGRAGRRINSRSKHARRLGILEVESLLEDAAQVTVGLAARLNVAVGPVANLAGSLCAVEPREEGSAAFGFSVGGEVVSARGCHCPG